MKHLTQHLALALVTVVSIGCTPVAALTQQAAEGSFRRTLTVTEPVSLDVSTGSGSITIREGDADQIEISAAIRVRARRGRSMEEALAMVDQLETDPPIELSGRRLRIGELEDEFRRNVTISYQIDVPGSTTVKSRTGSGNVRITSVTGPVEARTGSGALRLNDIQGRVIAQTGSGSIQAEAVAGPFEGRTGSGSVTLFQTAEGDVEVFTGSGSVRLDGVNGTLRVQTGSGSVTVEGEQAGRWELQTGSGSIRLTLPEDSGFDLNAQTASGEFLIDHPITIQGRMARRSRIGTVRGGGPTLQLWTGSGDIRIE